MKGRYQMMKKLMAILLMVSLLMCFFTCFASAEAPVADTEGESEIGGVDEPENEKNTFKFEPAQFVDNLYYMGVGMVGIFLVIGIIILATVALNRVFSGKAKTE
jgi:uncharacterized membrane protein